MNISVKLVRKCEEYKENYSYLDHILPTLEFRILLEVCPVMLEANKDNCNV